MKIRRALLSVTDKSNLSTLAKFLVDEGVELIASGGTRRYLEEAGLPVIELAAWTGSPEALGGRVKTLHPKVFGGILADPELHGDDLSKMDFPLIDLVVCNLYRFQEAASDTSCSFEEIIEAIDIGGPSLIRASAKNHRRVSVLCRTEDYDDFIRACQAGSGDPGAAKRREWASTAFAHTRDYDLAIADWLGQGGGEFGEELQSLRYGENPHQKGWLHAWRAKELPFHQHQGKELSYNNILDLGGALDLIMDLEGPAAAVIKHSNPCGVGFGKNSSEALERAWSSDPVSAFGSVIALSHKVDEKSAEFLADKFFEVLIAPEYDQAALTRFSKKKNLRVLSLPDPKAWHAEERLRSVGPMLLRQEEDRHFTPSSDWQLGAGPKPSPEIMKELERAWRVVKHVKSNAVLLWSGDKLLAAGAGQMSRVDSCKIAVSKAREHGHEIQGSLAASDAFFPFADGLEILAEAGVKWVVQPGGSIRDGEVLARAEELGIGVLITGRRHFRH